MHAGRSLSLLAALVLVTVPQGLAFVLVGLEDPDVHGRDTRFVVGFEGVPRDMRRGDGYNGGTVARVDPVLHFAVVVAGNPVVFEARTRSDPNVRYVEPDPVRQLLRFEPDDPRWGDQYGPQQVRAPEAWDTTLGTTDRSVCIVDTGVRYTHDDLEGARWLGGTDYVNDDDDPMDDNGHGTHVAGTAAAGIDNGVGVAGIGNVGILGVKVLDQDGAGTWADVASGIRWCADNGGHVISMSLGGAGGAAVLLDAVQYAYGEGSLLVAAAGNDGPCNDCVDYPGAYDEVVAVTCTDDAEAQCGFSSEGAEAELAAPGDAILSTYADGDASYATISGTSMSTPHVSGVAALVWSHVPGLTNTDLRALLQDNAQDLGAAGRDEIYGFGEVDAKATLDAAGGAEPPVENVVFSETFDDGAADGWSLGGLWHVSDACSDPPSPPDYLGYDQDADCEYSTGARTTGSAQFEVDTSGATVGTLSFQHRWETESYAGGAYDIMRAQVSDDDGASWATLRQWDSRDANQLAWEPLSLSLDAYVGVVLDLRFFFDSVDSVDNAHEGWFVDDVEVTADIDGGEPANDPPVADAGPDQTVADDDGSGAETVTLDGSASNDPDGDIVSYEWHEGAELLAEGAQPAVSLATGSHSITLTVTDDDGASATDTVVVTVNANQAPTAAFVADCADLACTFDAAGSADPDGDIASYEWDLGDGDVASGVLVSHAYAAAGTYAVTLTVTDNAGATDDATQDVVVEEPAGAEQVYFEDFDDGEAQDWHKSNGARDYWRVADDCVTPASGAYQIAFSRADPNCDYDPGARATGWARSPIIDLSGYATATLSFAHFFEVEQYAGGAYDRMRVQVSDDAGASWTTLRQWDSRDANPDDWELQSFDVTEYISAEFRVRIHFDSVDGEANDFLGWYVDDVEVTAE